MAADLREGKTDVATYSLGDTTLGESDGSI